MNMIDAAFSKGKNLLFFALLFVLCSGCGQEEAQSGLTGKVAPNFTLSMLDSSTVSLNALKGKPVLLEFWAPWCSGCLKNISPLKKLYATYGDKVIFLASSSERGEKNLAQFVAKEQIPYPVGLSNQKLLTDYMVSGIPLTVLIDGEGIVRFSHVGQFSFDLLEKKILQLF
jgi:cytochrome c biogenesis protein CcmG/thiol:disulfide interchange protein DsbE